MGYQDWIFLLIVGVIFIKVDESQSLKLSQSRMKRFSTDIKSIKRRSVPDNLTTITMAVIVPTEKPYLFRRQLVQPAVEYAVEATKNDMASSGYKLKVIYRDSFCSRRAALAVVDVYYSDDAMYNQSLNMSNKKIEGDDFFNSDDAKKKRRRRSADRPRSRDSPIVFFGLACNYAMSVASVFTDNWNVPLISGGAPAPWIEPGPEYPTLTRVAPNYFDFAYFISTVFNSIGYGIKVPIHILYEDGFQGVSAERECRYIMQALYHDLNRIPNIRLYGPTYVVDNDFDENRVASDMGDPRVVLMCASSDVVRRIMLGAFRTGYANPRRNLWYAIDLHNTTYYTNGAWKRNDDQDEMAKVAFRALHVITSYSSNSPGLRNFVAKMNEEYKKAGVEHRKTVNEFANIFHDGVLLYANAVRIAHDNGIDVRDGRAMSRTMRNITINGIAGPVVMSENGDRHGDYSILAMKNFNTGTFKSVYDFLGSWEYAKNRGMPKLNLFDLRDGLNYTENKSGVDVKAILNEAKKEKAKRLFKSATQHEILVGILGTLGGMILCFALIFGPMCYHKKRRSRGLTSENGNAVGQFLNGNSDRVCLHRPLREEESVNTCTTTIDDDQKL